jgi:hypothetical protein
MLSPGTKYLLCWIVVDGTVCPWLRAGLDVFSVAVVVFMVIVGVREEERAVVRRRNNREGKKRESRRLR